MSEVGKIELATVRRADSGADPAAGTLGSHRSSSDCRRAPSTGPRSSAAAACPLVVDLGCGSAVATSSALPPRPARLHDHVGIDILPPRPPLCDAPGPTKRGLSNLRLAAVDGQRFVHEYLEGGSVREMHCYHPQPFHDSHLADRRLLSPRFLAETLRVLEPDGKLFLQTDNPAYWKYLTGILQQASSSGTTSRRHGPTRRRGARAARFWLADAAFRSTAAGESPCR